MRMGPVLRHMHAIIAGNAVYLNKCYIIYVLNVDIVPQRASACVRFQQWIDLFVFLATMSSTTFVYVDNLCCSLALSVRRIIAHTRAYLQIDCICKV